MPELCRLMHIGEKRAERIIRYRQDVQAIMSVEALATAAGLSLRQALQIADDIDWGQDAGRRSNSNAGPVIAALSGLLLIAYFIVSSGIDTSSASALLFNGSVLLLISGCFLTIVAGVTRSSHLAASAFQLAAIACLACGAALLASLCLKVAFSDADDPLSRHIIASWRFVGFAGVVILVQFGPGLAFRLTPARLTGIRRLYDFCLPVIALAVLIAALAHGPSDTIETIFLFWASIAFGLGGFTLARRGSAFASALPDDGQTALRFLDEENGQSNPRRKTARLAGNTTMVAAALLAAISITMIVGLQGT